MYVKIFPAETIKKIDALTIEKQGITSLQLMDRAVESLYEALAPRLKRQDKIVVMAGVGNNGGDGLGLVRLLVEYGFEVLPVIVPFSEKYSHDFKAQLKRLDDAGINYVYFKEAFSFEPSVVIDAIFGVGLNRPATGIAAKAIAWINSRNPDVYAIDMPSGMYADRLNSPSDAIVRAGTVFTFQFPKYAFFFAENDPYLRDYELVDIGLDKEVIKNMPSTDFYVVKPLLYPRRYRRFVSKSDFGHVMIIGGSWGKTGAVRYAAEAALRTGAGWVSAYVPRKTAEALQIASPSVMCQWDDSENIITKIDLADDRYTVAIGPGLGTDAKTVQAFSDFIKHWKKPLILDADALNILAQNPGLLQYLHKESILTPHDGELKRLAGEWKDTPGKWDKAVELARRHNLIVVAKGPYTLTTDGEYRFFNSTGNAALAKAGSGDVLTGIIAALRTRESSALAITLSAVWLHGKAADLYVEKYTSFSLTPADLIEMLKFVKYR